MRKGIEHRQSPRARKKKMEVKKGFEKDGTGVTGLIDSERISNLVAGNGTVRAL